MMCVGNHIPWNVPPESIKRYLDRSAEWGHRWGREPSSRAGASSWRMLRGCEYGKRMERHALSVLIPLLQYAGLAQSVQKIGGAAHPCYPKFPKLMGQTPHLLVPCLLS